MEHVEIHIRTALIRKSRYGVYIKTSIRDDVVIIGLTKRFLVKVQLTKDFLNLKKLWKKKFITKSNTESYKQERSTAVNKTGNLLKVNRKRTKRKNTENRKQPHWALENLYTSTILDTRLKTYSWSFSIDWKKQTIIKREK